MLTAANTLYTTTFLTLMAANALCTASQGILVKVVGGHRHTVCRVPGARRSMPIRPLNTLSLH